MTDWGVGRSSVLDSQHGAIHLFSEPVPYLHAWQLQLQLHHDRVLDRRHDTILILEHHPVYTLGRSTDLSHVHGETADLCRTGAELHRVNRGGSVTYHGPGQIVAYPILKLAGHAPGPRQLVWLLEEAMIQVLNRWNIAGLRIAKRPGVWVQAAIPEKIGFVGIRIDRGVTLHGLALNVDLDLAPFQHIHPCGFADCRVTSMATVSAKPLSIEAVKAELAQVFRIMFNLNQSAIACGHSGTDSPLTTQEVCHART
ncbi:MAG TPA: lipoyl(octanoyl) transferase LipB [Nitrospira sp.]|nr:lipoyl(octanoyl) transferase LipB [Nitrospira sp.]